MSVGLNSIETDARAWSRRSTSQDKDKVPTMIQGSRQLKGSAAQRDSSVSSAGSHSISTIMKDPSSLTKRLEAMEQQMLATHMRAAAASEAAEVVAQNMVAPFSDEISALKARMEMTEQQILNCAPASQIERLSDRLLEAEVRITTAGPTSIPEGGLVNTDQAVALARLEERVSVLSRQMHDTAVKVEDIEQGRLDSERVDRCVQSVESIAAMMQEQQVRQGASTEALTSRLETLEQQLTLCQREVIELQTPQHAAVAELADRLNGLESSYQEMGSAIMRQSETIRPIVENEISGLVIRLDAQEKMIQSNAAQAIHHAQNAEENRRQKDSYSEDMINRFKDVEEKLQALMPLSQQTSTLSTRITMAEKQLAANPSAADMRKLQAEMQASVEAAEWQFKKAAELTGQGGSGVINPQENPEASPAWHMQVEALRHGLDDVRKETGRLGDESTRLAESLAEERQERFLALADVNRLSEVVAKAAASTIERAEQRFAEELGTEREKLRQELAVAREMSLSYVSTGGSVKDSTTCQDTASVSSAGEMNRQLKAAKGASLGVGSDLARCIGEMDAELRMELTGCLEEVHKDLERARTDLSVRIGTIEKRLQAVEDNSAADVKDMAEMYMQYAGLDPTKSTEVPRINLRPHSRRLAQEAKVESFSSGPGSVASVDIPAARTTPGSSTREMSAGRVEALIQTKNPPAAMLSEMFQQAMKQIMPAATGQQTVSDDRRAGSPVRQPEISEDLKANLRNLVSAVNRTLGDNEPGMPGAMPGTMPGAAERNVSAPFRTALRSSSPPQRGAQSHSVPPNMMDGGVGTASTGSLHLAAPATPATPAFPFVGSQPINRGRSSDGAPAGTPQAQPSWPSDRAVSPGKMAPVTPTSRNSMIGTSGTAVAGLSSTAGSLSAAASANASRLLSSGGKGGSVNAMPKDAANMTWPNNTFARQPLQQDRVMQGSSGSGLAPRPSAGTVTPGHGQSAATQGQALSPRSRPISQVPSGTEHRGVSRSQDATSIQRTGATPGSRIVSSSPAPQMQPSSKTNLRSGWKR